MDDRPPDEIAAELEELADEADDEEDKPRAELLRAAAKYVWLLCCARGNHIQHWGLGWKCYCQHEAVWCLDRSTRLGGPEGQVP